MRLQKYLNEVKGVTFVRFGGLSKTNQKKYGIAKNFHKAPVNKGIFAFIYPYIETFLFAWKQPDKLPPEHTEWKWDGPEWKEWEKKRAKDFQKFYRDNKKKFTYSGWIWTHFTDASPKYIRKRKGSWVEIHTSDWNKIFKKQKHLDMVQLAEPGWEQSKDAKNPYKRGLGGFISKDHLEVFIEKVN